jgi:AcrR family transcriptional regulator
MTSTTRRGRPSPETSRQKLLEVLSAAREEFSTRGYRAVTIRSVAERAQVSTRTLYNRFKDKPSLFAACLDVGAVDFPTLPSDAGRSPADTLSRFAADLVKALTADCSMRISMLVYREGADFPELVAAAQATQERHLVEPLAAFLRQTGIGGPDPVAGARLFTTMATAQWQRAAVFGDPMPTDEATERHAAWITGIFLYGAVDRRDSAV